MREGISKIIKYACVGVVILTTVKMLFVGYDIDEQYAFALSYRMLQGDVPILEMWEPHQTSAFFLSLVMLPYIKLFSANGVVLYSRAVSLLIHILMMSLLNRYLKKVLGAEEAFYLTSIVFFSLPKIMFLCEFSNLQMWFLLGLILALAEYGRSGRQRHLIFGGTCLGFELLVYPSTLLILPVVFGFCL